MRHRVLQIPVLALAILIGLIQLFIVGSVYGFQDDDARAYLDATYLQNTSNSMLDLAGIPGETIYFTLHGSSLDGRYATTGISLTYDADASGEEVCKAKDEDWPDEITDSTGSFEFRCTVHLPKTFTPGTRYTGDIRGTIEYATRYEDHGTDWRKGYYKVGQYEINVPVNIRIVGDLAQAKSLRKGDVPAAYDISPLWAKALWIPLMLYATSLIALASGMFGSHIPEPSKRITFSLKLAGAALLTFLAVYLCGLFA